MDLRVRVERVARLRCPYCHDALGERLVRVACSACGTLHHAPCMDERRRCSVFGCAASQGLPSLEDARTPAEIREVFRCRARWYVAARRERRGAAADSALEALAARGRSVALWCLVLASVIFALVRA